MADELDDRLRAAMKTLDAEAPSGYFEALPEQLLAKLSTGEEVNNMQQSGTPNREASSSPTTTAPPVPREEDSGLHDIRNLAQSTKQRLSNKRITGSNATVKDDDVLASSSASWKNLALPQPANMVSLPELDELPSKQEIAKAAKAAAKETARAAKHEPKVTPSAVLDSASGSTAAAPASGAVEFKPAFSSFAAPKPKKATSHKGRNLALVGMGLAAAAGITLFVMTQNNDGVPRASEQAVAPGAVAANGASADKMKQLDEAAAKATAKLDAEHAAQLAAEATPPAAQGSAVAPPEAPTEIAAVATKAPAPTKAVKKPTVERGKGHGKVEATGAAAAPEQKADSTKTKAGAGGEAAPEKDKDFDALLKEAGVQDKKNAKPKLDKKELSGDDFKKGMAAITSKAQACYKGTQGEANVKLTVAPSGQVSKVTVSGTFAGKAEAACVSSAVKGASFPAWDGPPQSFGYPILLSE
jgi:hypothetical protein